MVTKHAKYLLLNKYIMMHLHSYSMRFNTLPKSSAMEFLVFPLLVPVHGIWLSTVNSPCSIVQKHNCVIPLYSYNDMLKSYIYIYVMVHSTCKCYLFLYFWHVLKHVLLLLLIHHFIMCNVFVMCNLSYIDNSMQSITQDTCFLTSSLKYFSFCILLVITWSTFIFFFKLFFSLW